MLTSILIPFLPKYYKEFVAKNNTSVREIEFIKNIFGENITLLINNLFLLCFITGENLSLFC